MSKASEVLLAAALCVGVAAGCKDDEQQAVPSTAVPVQSPTGPAPRAAAPDQPARPSTGKPWVYQEPDQRVPKRPRTASGSGQAGKRRAARPDADVEQVKRVAARNASRAAIQRALVGSMARLKACFDRHQARPGSVTISVRVNATGYVTYASAGGAETSVKVCLERVLGGVRVSGMQVDELTVSRTINYEG